MVAASKNNNETANKSPTSIAKLNIRSTKEAEDTTINTILSDKTKDNTTNQKLQPLPMQTVDVLIIGAGASGLQCAANIAKFNNNENNKEKISFCIIEARDRIGGRIYTTQETKTTIHGESVTFSYDHGAAWVHGTGIIDDENRNNNDSKEQLNPMMRTLTKDDLYPIVQGNPWVRPYKILHEQNEIALYVNGQQVANNNTIVANAIQEHYCKLNNASDYANELYDTGRGMDTVSLSLQDGLNHLNNKQNHKHNGNESGGNQTDTNLLSNFYLHMIECWNGTDISNLQLGAFSLDYQQGPNKDFTNDQGDFPGPHCFVNKGMISVLQPLIETVGSENIYLEQEVTLIQQQPNNGGILVTTKSGSQFLAKSTCVVTIPTSCLKHNHKVLFDPPLCQDKTEALKNVGMGLYKKVLLTFDKIFWPVEPAFVGIASHHNDNKVDNNEESKNDNDNNPLGDFLLIDNVWARKGIPCLEVVLFGRQAAWAKDKSNDEIQNQVLTKILKGMGIKDKDNDNYRVHDCDITRWEEDPYTMGAYSTFGLGTLDRHLQDLNVPEEGTGGTILLAGEGTAISGYEGSVHAALMSGDDVFEKVLECVKRKQE